MLKLGETVRAFCSFPWNRLKVTCEGDVTMCCFHQRGCLGNLLVTPLEEIWNGPVAQDIRRVTLTNRLHSTCAAATCPFISKQHRLPTFVHQFGDIGVPYGLEIDLPTQHCNIGGENPTPDNPACIMCERHTRFTPQVDRLNEVCAVLRPYMKWMRGVHIQGVSEPFWKDRIFEISEMLELERWKHRMHITTTTNGTILTRQRQLKWLSFPKSTLTFSLDASTPETFRKIRRWDYYDKIVAHMMEFTQLRGPTQSLKIHNNINTLNVDEVVGMVELAKKVRADFLEFNPTYACPEIEVNSQNANRFYVAEQQIREAAAKLGVNVSFLQSLSLNYVTLTV
jgi:molybdenum cofactor biosynthesis enzyme MoaA